MNKGEKILSEYDESTAKKGLILIEKDLLTGVYFCHYDSTRKSEVVKVLKLALKDLKPKRKKQKLIK